MLKALFIALIVICAHPIVCLGLEKEIIPTGAQKIAIEYFEGGGLALWNLRINIDEEGTVTDLYTWGVFTRDKKITKKVYQLTESEKQELDSLVLDANVFELDNEYSCKGTANHRCPTDMGWQTLKFTIDGKTKNISWNWSIPEKFAQISKKIRDLRKLYIEKGEAQPSD